MKKVAVILCGSGFKDGSEIRESVGVLWALSSHPVAVQCFAPDAPQADVVNCLTGQVSENENRNMLVEAARIARGAVKPLNEMRTADFDAIVLPGGWGAAKNLCSYAIDGVDGAVQEDVRRVLVEMAAAKKPIGAVCIAPMIVAMALRGQKLELTLGGPGEAAQDCESLGHRHVELPSTECHIDRTHKLVTTPAYMHGTARLNEIFEGIRKLVDAVVGLA